MQQPLPTHCIHCGVLLMGSATEHRAGCHILKLIEYAKTGKVPDPVCDFCTDASPAYSLGCSTFTFPTLSAQSISDWLACPLCYELIQSQDWDALAVRGCELTANGQMLAGFLGKGDATQEIKKLHEGFRDHATGKVTAL